MNEETAAAIRGAKFGMLPGRAVPLEPGARIVARQQLTDPAFYRAVRSGLLDGSITAVDQREDALVLDGKPVPLTERAAVEALAASQESWVGKPEPLDGGLLRGR